MNDELGVKPANILQSFYDPLLGIDLDTGVADSAIRHDRTRYSEALRVLEE